MKSYKIPAFIENDANCVALGEAVFGADKNYETVVGMTLGTGVGGGISQTPNLINKARQKTNKLIYYQAFKKTPIRKSYLQIRANLLGAYLLTKQYFDKLSINYGK